RNARISLINPYADWGTLVCDDSSQKMWKERKHDDLTSSSQAMCEYTGNAFCVSVYSGSGYLDKWISKSCAQLSDFVFQVHLKLEKNSTAGLIFRSDRTGDVCYQFELSFTEAVLLGRFNRVSVVLAGYKLPPMY